jgi:hypothetical protein
MIAVMVRFQYASRFARLSFSSCADHDNAEEHSLMLQVPLP